MATEESSYSIGHKEGPLAYMRSRTAEVCCAFFREHVRRDSRILDCGCGPGSVTVGLAQWAPDGETVGIDLGAEQLEGARALASNLGVENVSFRQGDIFDLPFEDNSFDVVFSHAVLLHLADPERALVEIRRVLRPGGLVAVRDIINASIIVWPERAAGPGTPTHVSSRCAAFRRQPRHWAGVGDASPRGGIRRRVLHSGWLPAA